MAKIPAAMTLLVSLDAAPAEVSLGEAEPVPVALGLLDGDAGVGTASAEIPLELVQSVVMRGGSETKVISAHCLMGVRYRL